MNICTLIVNNYNTLRENKFFLTITCDHGSCVERNVGLIMSDNLNTSQENILSQQMSDSGRLAVRNYNHEFILTGKIKKFFNLTSDTITQDCLSGYEEIKNRLLDDVAESYCSELIDLFHKIISDYPYKFPETIYKDRNKINILSSITSEYDCILEKWIKTILDNPLIKDRSNTLKFKLVRTMFDFTEDQMKKVIEKEASNFQKKITVYKIDNSDTGLNILESSYFKDFCLFIYFPFKMYLKPSFKKNIDAITPLYSNVKINSLFGIVGLSLFYNPKNLKSLRNDTLSYSITYQNIIDNSDIFAVLLKNNDKSEKIIDNQFKSFMRDLDEPENGLDVLQSKYESAIYDYLKKQIPDKHFRDNALDTAKNNEIYIDTKLREEGLLDYKQDNNNATFQESDNTCDETDMMNNTSSKNLNKADEKSTTNLHVESINKTMNSSKTDTDQNKGEVAPIRSPENSTRPLEQAEYASNSGNSMSSFHNSYSNNSLPKISRDLCLHPIFKNIRYLRNTQCDYTIRDPGLIKLLGSNKLLIKNLDHTEIDIQLCCIFQLLLMEKNFKKNFDYVIKERKNNPDKEKFTRRESCKLTNCYTLVCLCMNYENSAAEVRKDIAKSCVSVFNDITGGLLKPLTSKNIIKEINDRINIHKKNGNNLSLIDNELKKLEENNDGTNDVSENNDSNVDNDE
uniref:PX domain-containing protein n=1 Tax=Strongyloides venezuelensis TaxID=75913 RepID=A0A0K0EYY8_STRVS